MRLLLVGFAVVLAGCGGGGDELTADGGDGLPIWERFDADERAVVEAAARRQGLGPPGGERVVELAPDSYLEQLSRSLPPGPRYFDRLLDSGTGAPLGLVAWEPGTRLCGVT